MNAPSGEDGELISDNNKGRSAERRTGGGGSGEKGSSFFPGTEFNIELQNDSKKKKAASANCCDAAFLGDC
jgi:hypothetical protein